jgi:hypothetical protein
MLGQNTEEIKVYSTLWCSDCERTKSFFGECRILE